MGATMTASAHRPNLIFFIPDELRASSVGCYGDPVSTTPNIDRLASQGTRFDQCHVQHTVCTPSRTSFTTGWYPHVRGHRTLWNMLRPEDPNLLKYLKRAVLLPWRFQEMFDEFAAARDEIRAIRDCQSEGLADRREAIRRVFQLTEGLSQLQRAVRDQDRRQGAEFARRQIGRAHV